MRYLLGLIMTFLAFNFSVQAKEFYKIYSRQWIDISYGERNCEKVKKETQRIQKILPFKLKVECVVDDSGIDDIKVAYYMNRKSCHNIKSNKFVRIHYLELYDDPSAMTLYFLKRLGRLNIDAILFEKKYTYSAYDSTPNDPYYMRYQIIIPYCYYLKRNSDNMATVHEVSDLYPLL